MLKNRFLDKVECTNVYKYILFIAMEQQHRQKQQQQQQQPDRQNIYLDVQWCLNTNRDFSSEKQMYKTYYDRVKYERKENISKEQQRNASARLMFYINNIEISKF